MYDTAGLAHIFFLYAGAYYLSVSLLINKDTALNENLFQKCMYMAEACAAARALYITRTMGPREFVREQI